MRRRIKKEAIIRISASGSRWFGWGLLLFLTERVLLFLTAMIVRIQNEERILLRFIPTYLAYTDVVRYRLVAYI